MGYALKQFLIRHMLLVAAWIIIMTVYVGFGASLSDDSTTYAVSMLAASICMLMIWFSLLDIILDDTFLSTWAGAALCIASLCGGAVAFINFIYVL